MIKSCTCKTLCPVTTDKMCLLALLMMMLECWTDFLTFGLNNSKIAKCLASCGRLEMKPKRGEIGRHIKGHKGHKTERDHGLGMLIASLWALLFIAKSLEIFHSLRSLLTDSFQVSLGWLLPLFTLSVRFRTPLRTGASGGLCWICSNHLNRY
jgi:hypothetical protein